ncbi:MAG: thioredoxin family protein [Bacteroidales bacterium]|nr:thioredoxin family protein [Bacteroidales bacterium]MBN2698184.1 thioredoxin family protein [Bacteroidales bacterium]
MKNILLSVTLFFALSSLVPAQIADPVEWSFSYEQTGNSEVTLIFKANIDRPWHLYSAYLPEGGPIPTKVHFDDRGEFTLSGGLLEVTKPKIKYDEGFRMELGTIDKYAELRQKVLVPSAGSITVTGEIEYQVCDDLTCLPPKLEAFSIPVTLEGTRLSSEDKSESDDRQVIGQVVSPDKDTHIEQSDSEANPADISFQAGNEDEKSLWRFFWIAFGLGLLALLTPCVFPMIPMTVSFFMQGSGNRARGIVRGLVFGLSIVGIYTLLGIIVSLTNLGPNAANALSTHWIPNLIFFLLFVLFAFSFFGMFELILPSGWINKADKHAEGAGLGGPFFMALTTVLVSFSCTGPIVGALLVEAAGGLALKPILGMFGFALAFAIPFTLFAMFPSWLKGLPKSGGWLNSVKVVLGFIILAFAMKFLLPLDPGNRVLTRELFLSVWIVLFFFLGLYFLGKLKFAHDSDVPYVTVPRLLLSVTSFAFVVLLFTGLFGAELKTISPLLPSKSPDGIDLTRNVSMAVPSADAVPEEACIPGKYTDLFQNTLGINMFYDLDEALACARETGKPVLIDFKGHFCSNCKKMEASVWSDPAVLGKLKNDFVVVALYTDDRTRLPESEWYASEVDGKLKKTVGQQNVDYEIKHFRTNTIPLYVIMNPEGEVVNQPRGTDLDVQSYLAWLEEGVRNATN